MKVYGITYGGDAPDTNLCEAARRIVAQRLAGSADSTAHYGVGFAGIHEGRDGNFVFVDWWANENELYHHVYVSTTEQPQRLEYRTPSGLAACAWDLYLMCFERNAWLDCVLQRHEEPDLDKYLATVINSDV
jgi:hypothetical protein